MKKNKSDKNFILKNAVSALIFAAILIIVITGVNNASEANQINEERSVHESIMRAVLTCYAIEGIYPPSFEYLKENYDLCVNEEKYIIFYNIFASNIMPDITVMER